MKVHSLISLTLGLLGCHRHAVPSPTPRPEVAALVNGHPILVKDVEARAEREFSRLRTDEQRDTLRARRDGFPYLAHHLDALVNEEILVQESERLGVRVTDDEVRTEARRTGSLDLDGIRQTLVTRRVLDYEVRARFPLDGIELQQAFKRWVAESHPTLSVLMILGSDLARVGALRQAASVAQAARDGEPLCELAAAALDHPHCTVVDETNATALDGAGMDVAHAVQWLSPGEVAGPLDSTQGLVIVQLQQATIPFGHVVQARYLELELRFRALEDRWAGCLRRAASILVNPRIGLPTGAAAAETACRAAY